MTTLKNRVFTLLKLFHSVKDENLQWQANNLDQQIKLKHTSVIAEKVLEAELKKKSVRLAHEITLLQTKNDSELSMLKTKCKQDIKDYKQYLTALDQLKKSIKISYTHLPEAVAFTIHHHAKQLLNQMWEAEGFEQKMHHEIQLINFMTTVHEDARMHMEGVTTEKLPERTLSLIQQKGSGLNL
jgi:phage terminase small subunit